jgi:hypothetical protein
MDMIRLQSTKNINQTHNSEYEKARLFQEFQRQGLNPDQARAAIADVEFEQTHRISRAQWLAARAAWAEDDARTAILSGVEGDPPYPTLPGVPRAESMFRNYLKWVADLEKEVARLEAAIAGVADVAAVVPELQAKRADVLARLARRAAEWLTGGIQDAPSATELTALDVEIATAAAKAEVSEAAASQVERRLADRRAQLHRLQQRRQEFLRAALLEKLDAEAAEGARKLKRQLREVGEYVRRVQALANAAGVNRSYPDVGLRLAPTGVELQAVEKLTQEWEAQPTTTN